MKLFKVVSMVAPLALVLVVSDMFGSDIDRAAMDKSCKPCDDFWRFANGGWIDKNPIPASKSGWGTMGVMAEANRERARTILEAARVSAAPAGSNERKIGDFYASCMDTAAIDKRGMEPLRKDLELVKGIHDAKGVAATIVALQGSVQSRGESGGGRGGGGDDVLRVLQVRSTRKTHRAHAATATASAARFTAGLN